MSIDYSKPPDPPLKGKDATWASELIRKRTRPGNGLGKSTAS